MKTKLFIAAMLAAAGLAGAQMFAQMFGGETWTPAALNPIAWYRAENDATDSVGLNNGSWTGTAVYADGKVGRAYSFDGTAKLVTSSLVIPAGNVSISAWIYPNIYSNYRAIAGASYLGSGNGMGLGLSASTVFSQSRGAAGINTAQANWTHGSFNGWSHVVGIRQTDKIRIYINGTMIDEQACSAFLASDQVFGIGSRVNGGTWGYHFSGLIDDVIVSGRAWSAAEVKKLYDESVLKNGAAW